LGSSHDAPDSRWFYPPSEFEKLKSIPKLRKGNVAVMEQYRQCMAKE